jgi:hypothetical protein
MFNFILIIIMIIINSWLSIFVLFCTFRLTHWGAQMGVPAMVLSEPERSRSMPTELDGGPISLRCATPSRLGAKHLRDAKTPSFTSFIFNSIGVIVIKLLLINRQVSKLNKINQTINMASLT